MTLQHGWWGLLDLEEERIIVVASEQQQDEAAGANAAHTNDLAREIDDAVAVEQTTLCATQCPQVDVEQPLQLVPNVFRRNAHDERGIVGDDTLAIHLLGQLRKRLDAV